MNTKSLKLWFAGILLSETLLFGSVPFFAQAQTINVPAASAPEQTRCNNFWDSFTVNKDTITQNRESEFSGSITKGAPKICSASSALLWIMYLAFALAGTVAVVFLIIGGFQYLTAAGNDEQAEKGKKTLTTSIIGLVVILLSVMIVRIVTNALTGTLNGAGSSSGNQNQTTGDNGGNNPTGQGGSGQQQPTVQMVVQVDTIPAAIPRDGTIQLHAGVLAEDAASFSNLCGTSIDQASITATYVDAVSGQEIFLGAPRFGKLTNSLYLWTLTVGGSSIPSNSQQGKIVLTACGKQITEQQVSITQGLSN